MATLALDLRQFFVWWGQELLGLLPNRLLGTRLGSLPKYTVSKDAAGLRLLRQHGTAAQSAITAPSGIITVAELARLLRRSANGDAMPTVGLRLHYSDCFVRRVELPSAAARDFPRLLALDLERATPFKAKDVLTAFRMETTQANPGTTVIWQSVVKRSHADGTIGDLAAVGIRVSHLDCWNEYGTEPLPLNFMDARATENEGNRRAGTLPKVLAAIAALLGTFAVYLVIERHSTALADLQAQSRELKKKVQAARDADARSQAMTLEIENFRRLRASSASRTAALEELTRLLPDTAWVTDLKIDGSSVNISGLAKSAVSLIPILEKSKLFFDAISAGDLDAIKKSGSPVIVEKGYRESSMAYLMATIKKLVYFAGC